MKIIYNGRLTEVSNSALSDIAKELSIEITSTIIEINGEIIPQNSKKDIQIKNGDILNSFKIVAGG